MENLLKSHDDNDRNVAMAPRKKDWFIYKGLKILFPKESMHDIQKDFMGKVIDTLENSNQNALLEGPTGMGKTLCLLAASLAWLNNNSDTGVKIIYCSRTVLQVNNVVEQLKEYAGWYKIKLAFRTSRKYYCINEDFDSCLTSANEFCKARVPKESTDSSSDEEDDNINKRKKKNDKKKKKSIKINETEETKENAEIETCKYYLGLRDEKGAFREDNKSDLFSEVRTIDEMKSFGQSYTLCPFYLNNYASEDANFLCLNYNYIINFNETVRLENSIVIFDEAHNVENICEEKFSIIWKKTSILKAIEYLFSFEYSRPKYIEEKQKEDQKKKNNHVDNEKVSLSEQGQMEQENKDGNVISIIGQLNQQVPANNETLLTSQEIKFEYPSQVEIKSETIIKMEELQTPNEAVHLKDSIKTDVKEEPEGLKFPEEKKETHSNEEASLDIKQNNQDGERNDKPDEAANQAEIINEKSGFNIEKIPDPHQNNPVVIDKDDWKLESKVSDSWEVITFLIFVLNFLEDWETQIRSQSNKLNNEYQLVDATDFRNFEKIPGKMVIHTHEYMSKLFLSIKNSNKDNKNVISHDHDTFLEKFFNGNSGNSLYKIAPFFKTWDEKTELAIKTLLDDIFNDEKKSYFLSCCNLNINLEYNHIDQNNNLSLVIIQEKLKLIIKDCSKTKKSKADKLTKILRLVELLSDSKKGGGLTDKYKLIIRNETGESVGNNKIKEENEVFFENVCLSPAVCFRKLNIRGVRNIIMTSGTLFPFDYIEQTFNTKFAIKQVFKHICRTEFTFFPAIVSNFNDMSFEFNLKNESNPNYLKTVNALGEAITKIVEQVDNGILIFFASFQKLNFFKNMWKSSGIYEKINQIKNIYSEEQGKDLDKIIENYKTNAETKSGALLFAVCGGRLSEGFNFSDNLARCVIIVGIPYQNLNNYRVSLKKRFTSSDDFNNWYTLQAFRKINQTVGRTLRHYHDWGLTFLFDKRFKKESMKKYFSEWISDSFYKDKEGNFNKLLEKVKTFLKRDLTRQGIDDLINLSFEDIGEKPENHASNWNEAGISNLGELEHPAFEEAESPFYDAAESRHFDREKPEKVLEEAKERSDNSSNSSEASPSLLYQIHQKFSNLKRQRNIVINDNQKNQKYIKLNSHYKKNVNNYLDTKNTLNREIDKGKSKSVCKDLKKLEACYNNFLKTMNSLENNIKELGIEVRDQGELLKNILDSAFEE